MSRAGRTSQIGLIAIVVMGCGSGPDPIASAPELPYGTPIEAGPRPDPSRCQEMIRAEIGAAVRIRTELMTPGVATDEAAARAAAADPGADTKAAGVPLTRAELRALTGNGFARDDRSAIDFWVASGGPERFGGVWVRDGDVLTVAVLRGDSATLALARCVEPPDRITYVWAGVSLAEGTAILDRIGADMDRWRASGLEINTIDYDETSGVVNVGVTTPTAAGLTELQAAYGPLVRLVQAGPGMPL